MPQDAEVKALARDHRGTLWVGTTGGLYELRGLPSRPRFVRWAHDRADSTTISGDYINELYVDTDGRLWIGTLRGLNVLDPGTGVARRFPVDPTDSLALNAPIVTAILQSLAYPGQLWVGTEKGLCRVDVAAFNLTGARRFRHFGAEDGFIGIECVHNAAAIDATGRLWFGTIDGLTSFAPTDFAATPHTPRVHIMRIGSVHGDSSLETFGESFDRSSRLPLGLELPHDRAHLSFDFVGLSFAAPGSVHYRYRMLGLDDRWTSPNETSHVSYPSLRAGDYTFEVVALDRDELDPETVDQTLGLVLKTQEDLQAVRGEQARALLNRAQFRGVRSSDSA